MVLAGFVRAVAVAVAAYAVATAAGQTAEGVGRYTVPSYSMNAFRESVAIATHLSYNDGLYADAPATLKELQYLGIRHVRDGIVTGTQSNEVNALHSIRYLMAAGIRFTFILGGSQDVDAGVRRIGELAAEFPHSVDAVEGPNEVDNVPVPGPGTPDENALSFQRRLYQAVHHNPRLLGVPVLFMTGSPRVSLAKNAGLADAQNTHPYAQAGQMPWEWILRADRSSYIEAPGFPKATTESGYSTTLKGNYNGVDPDTQAELVLTNMFDLFLTGHTLNALYQLREAYPNASINADTGYGLFSFDGSPKPAAIAIHRFMSRFNDQPAMLRGIPPIQIEGARGTTHAMVLASSRGRLSIWVWDEAMIWDPNQQKRDTPRANGPVVLIHIRSRSHREAHIFDPLGNPGTEIYPTVLNGEAVYRVSVGTHPTALLVDISSMK